MRLRFAVKLVEPEGISHFTRVTRRGRDKELALLRDEYPNAIRIELEELHWSQALGRWVRRPS